MAAHDSGVKTSPAFGLRRSGSWPVALAALVTLAIFVIAGQLAAASAIGGAVFILAITLAFNAIARNGTGSAAVSAETDASSGIAPFDAAISAFADPAILLDRDERVLSFNTPAGAVAPALRRGEHASLALRVPELVEAVRRAAATGNPEKVEFSERIPVERWFLVFVNPLPVVDGAGPRQPFLMLSFRDLTPVRQVEEMRADFVANASHELRTPLAALSGFIETLRGAAREDPVARERFLGIMEAQARRMARLIDDLLSLSRIELNAHLRPEARVELLPVVRQVVDTLQTLAQDRGVEITIAAPKDALAVAGDRDELIRVFENLVENALKYGGAGKRVEITLAREASAGGDEAAVAVRDYGPGIAAEHLPRLTERFYRVDVAGSRAQGGTGLGLALVKHILNRHRGRLNVDSKVGQGATFTVRLPLLPSGEN